MIWGEKPTIFGNIHIFSGRRTEKPDPDWINFLASEKPCRVGMVKLFVGGGISYEVGSTGMEVQQDVKTKTIDCVISC